MILFGARARELSADLDFSVNDAAQNFSLVFEGLDESSPEALRAVKGILLVDLNLSVEDAQRILSSAPAPVKEAASEAELEPLRRKLTKAGARVLVVRPTQDEEESDDGVELTFELDASEMFTRREEPGEKPVKVYELPVDEADISALSFDEVDAAASNEGTEPAIEEPPTIDLSTAGDLSFDEGNPSSEEATDAPNDLDSLLAIPSQLQRAELDVPLAAPSSSTSHDDLTDKKESTPSSGLEFDELIPREVEPEEYTPIVQVQEEQWDSEDALTLNPPPIEESAPQLAPPAAEPPPTAEPAATSPRVAPPVVERSVPDSPRLTESATLAVSEQSEVVAREEHTHPEESQEPRHTVAKPERAARHSARKGRDLTQRLLAVPLDVVLPVCVGGLILLVANWLYFSMRETSLPSHGEILQMLPPEVRSARTERRGDSTTNSSSDPVLVTYRSTGTVGGTNIEAEVVMVQQKLERFTLVMTNNVPPPHPPEHIVSGVPRAPWLYKVELSELPFELQSEGVYTAKGQAKAYVDYKNERTRVLIPATARVRTTSSSAFVTFQVLQGYAAVPPLGIAIEALKEGGFKVALKGEVVAPLVPQRSGK